MTARITLQLRGVDTEIEYWLSGKDDLLWYPPKVWPPLTEYEERSIDVRIRNQFDRDRQAWRARKAQRHVVIDVARRRML